MCEHRSESGWETKKFKMVPVTFYNHLISQSRANYHCSYANEVVSDLIKMGCFEEGVSAIRESVEIIAAHWIYFFLTQAISALWTDST